MLFTLSQLKSALHIPEEDVQGDLELLALGQAVQDTFEAYCGRKFGRAVESDQFRGNERSVFPTRVPLESVTSVEWYDPVESVWTALTGLHLTPVRNLWVEFDTAPGMEAMVCRLNYIGGFVLPDSADQTGMYPLDGALTSAALIQARAMWQRKDKLAFVNVGEKHATMSMSTDLLVMEAQTILYDYRRLLI